MIKHWKESNMILALNTLRTSPHLPIKKVAQIYQVPYNTLRRRYYRQPLQQDTQANS
jgi:helix-turn-helix, Psq domain